MMTVLAPPTRPEDLPLHEDVRRLAAALGRVIRRLEGDDAFQHVETLRRDARARRRGDPGAPTLEQLLARVEALSLPHCATAARAFTLFFLLINTAEQVHRVRRSRVYARDADAAPQPASARWTMRKLRADGRSPDDVLEAISRLDVRPVLTAHPTESTRRTLLALQARVADLLLGWEMTAHSERRAFEERLDGEIELLWLTAEVRQDRPTVLDEVSTGLWYLETRLIDASAAARDALMRAFEDEFGATGDALRIPVPIRLGNWVGGDRDGNPNVTPETTLASARRASHVILGRYGRALDDLIERLSLSAQLAPPLDALLASLEVDRGRLPDVWATNRARNESEPVRLKLSFMSARIAATRRLVASRDAGVPRAESAAYADAAAFELDLLLVRQSVLLAGAVEACRTVLDPTIAIVRAHGFHGFMMDVRDHADMHRAATDEITSILGLSALDAAAMRVELSGRRPLVGAHLPVSDATRRVLDTFRAIRVIQQESGTAAASTYIVSMAREPDDLLRVLLLARETGLVDLAGDSPLSHIDVVPLFETLDDLDRAASVMRELLADPVYRRQLAARNNRQEVMLGYSDSAKDAGLLSASWALYRAQEELAAVFRDAGVDLVLFHGRGGGVGRGGGSPVHRALSALPPETVNGRIKITEQGEIISQQFGLLPVAERTLEVTVSGVLLHGFTDWRRDRDASEVARFREIVDDLARRSYAMYSDLVHDRPELFALFRTATPIAELADARFGSRPAYRPGAHAGMDGIRAIPWAFGWTQIRLMLTGWLGVGTALAEVCASPSGLRELQHMARTWPFFDDFLAKVEMVCAKTDLEIARAYVEHLGGDVELLSILEEEFTRTVDSVLRIRETTHLIADVPVLQAAIALRNPYVDPLSLIQIALLRRKRSLPERSEERVLVEEILSTTLSGIAQGLRNTG
jgi:phosphoenolpyruvate carboxylase